MVTEYVDLVYTAIWSLALANVFGAGLSIFLSKPITRLTVVPFSYLAPFLILIITFAARGAWWKAWFASCLTIVSATAFGVIGLFPRLLPSKLDPAASLTIYNSSSSPLTLKVMTVVALIFVPIVILYQIWAYKLFNFKLTPEMPSSDPMAHLV